ncbi:response regulator [Microbacterium sp. 18062]|uniref:response regulator n=1 Tax=Microbacterium sp. 18062 TaxID=2681410 RepID=UPI00135C4C0F|nr:response regulator transcription factor [Microbacterium sp. 18062]
MSPHTSQKTLRTAIVEDQPLYREMITIILDAADDFHLAGSADSIAAAATFTASELDVVLLDVQLPDGSGIDLGLSLQAANPRLPVVLISATDQLDVLLELPDEQRSRWSYLSKTSSLSTQTLLHALRSAAAGRSVIDRTLVERRRGRPNGRLAVLTARQQEVMALLAAGLSNRAIAARLEVSERSVDNQINSIYHALELSGDKTGNPRVRATRIFLEETR